MHLKTNITYPYYVGKYTVLPAESYGTYLVIQNLEDSDFGQYSAVNNNDEIIQSYIIIKSG